MPQHRLALPRATKRTARARRLHTVMEKLLEEISFTASDTPGQTITIDAAYVRDRVSVLAKNADLSKFIL